jgi:hypothetical protein
MVTESPYTVAQETARELAKHPEVLVRAATIEYSPEWAEPMIEVLARHIEFAIRRCTRQED